LGEIQTGGENYVVGVIRKPINNLYESDECIEFKMKNQDTVHYDVQNQTLKIVFSVISETRIRREPNKTRSIVKKHALIFTIPSKNSFKLFMRKLRTNKLIKFQCEPFDSFEIIKPVVK